MMLLKVEISLFFLYAFLFIVENKTQFSLKITKYQTYSYRRLDGECCGHSTIPYRKCPDPCNQRFKICLEYYQAQVTLTDPKPYSGPCAYGMRETKTWGSSDMDFKTEHMPSYSFTIKASWPGHIAVIIEAYDTTEKKQSLRSVIDRVVYRNFLKPTLEKKYPEEWVDVSIANGPSIYQFSINVFCKSDYYGESCDRYCKNNSGNYKCDENGEKVCNHGWMGVDCNITICKPGCHRVHGYCLQPNECTCRDGWKGIFCDECIKYPGCKHGTCIDSPWTCHCDNNWGGHFCDQSLNYCAGGNPCKNEGICENDSTRNPPYVCICPSGYRGRNCEIDPCFPNPCKKGTCFKANDGFYCSCLTGWIGKTCDQDTNSCDPNFCQNGGRCEKDEMGFYKCSCPRGFKGSECHIADPCEKSLCQHAYDCQIQSTALEDYKCNCRDGWTGRYCDKEINECESKPCKNDGVCKDLINDYQCICKAGFKGKNCELNIACQNKPCKNGGVCQETENGYVCKCKKGYSGTNCEIYKTGCSPNPCLNSAYCYTIEQDFYCQCKSGFWGKRCEHPRPYCGKESCETAYDACAIPQMINSSEIKHHYCGKYGTCLSKGKLDFMCRCMPGFEGPSCEININDCNYNSCENNGICIDGINDFECICDNGFHGKRCEIKMEFCNPNPCINNGKCKEVATVTFNDFICECPQDWGGRLCHLPMNTVCNVNACLNGGTCKPDTTRMNGFTCECKSGWSGSVCQFLNPSSTPCISKPFCKNGGVCVPQGHNEPTCLCPAGYEGRLCETNINECNPDPCFNGGKCIDMINSYQCNCSKGFYGTNCQLNIDDCVLHPCAYGAVCVDRIDGYECRCPEGRRGELCDQVLNNEPPQPPSCVFHERTFDSGETWSYNCQNCRCDHGKISCKKIVCGVWNCLKASGIDDPYACKNGENCVPLPFHLNRCFVPPCMQKGICTKNENSFITVSWPEETPHDCQPNTNQKNNYCAQILLDFKKSNVPIGVTVDDICDNIKTLQSVKRYQNDSRGISLRISCDINSVKSTTINVAIYALSDKMYTLKSTQTLRPFAHYLSDQIAENVVEIVKVNATLFSGLTEIRVETLLVNSDSADRSNILKYLLVPIICFGVIIIIIVYCYHRKKTKEIREKYANSTKINNNNVQGQPLNAVRSQYPNILPPHLLEQSFYGPKIPQGDSRFAWFK